MLLDPDPFLNELTKLYERNKTSGSVWVTMKRTNLRSRKSKKAKEAAADGSASASASEEDYVCLVRATDGKKKISTKIGPKECSRFQAAYSLVQKAHMNSLKRKDKREKKKQQQAAKQQQQS